MITSVALAQVPAVAAPRCNNQQSLRNVVARGILDSYRRDKGLAAPAEQGNSKTSLLDRASKGLTGLLQSQQRPKGDSWERPDPDQPCFVECVTQVFTQDELQAALDDAGPDALVVVDFYKTACGACKYIQPGFVKLCRAAAKSRDGDDAPPIVFLKHNVYDDDEEEVTDLAKKYNVRSVPRFLFFKAGKEVDNFATREKDKVAAAILQHAPAGVELGDWE